MAEPKELKDLVAASFKAMDDYEAAQDALADDAERPPAPGDVYVLEATKDFDVEWVVVATDPADASRFLAVPADGHVLAGSADVALDRDSSVGALKLRCRFGTWTDGRFFRSDLRVGVLDDASLVKARQGWLDVGDGGRAGDVLSHEVDHDPGYHDWTAKLAEARQAVITARESAESDAPGGGPDDEEDRAESDEAPRRRPARKPWLGIAASVAVATLSVYLWRLNGRVQDLAVAAHNAEERHEAVVRQLETEQGRWMTERERLQEEQEALETAKAAREEEARQLREQVDTLDQRLDEAEKAPTVNPAVAFFGLPGETERGPVEVTLRPGQKHIILFLPLRESSPTPRYQIEVRERDGEKPIWTNDQLYIQEGSEIRVGLPVTVVAVGRYDLALFALEDDTSRRVASYRLDVFASPEDPR